MTPRRPRPETAKELNALAEAAVYERDQRQVAERDRETLIQIAQVNDNTILLLKQEIEAEKAKLQTAREWLQWIGTNSSCLTSRHKAWVAIDKIGKR